jgi:hypothetical protein
VKVTTFLEAIPELTWLLSPLGLGALAGLLILIFSGVLGRLVLYAESLRRSGKAQRLP